jgi:DNA-binding NarL/FixJ family response regulator
MRHHEPERLGRAVEQLARASRRPRHGESVEAVAPDAPLLGPPRGDRVADREIARRVATARERGDERRLVEPLTPRELEVLRALTDGLSTPEICDRLFIAPNTLRTHVQNIMGKLRVHSKLEAVAFALRYRLVEPPRPEDAIAG